MLRMAAVWHIQQFLAGQCVQELKGAFLARRDQDPAAGDEMRRHERGIRPRLALKLDVLDFLAVGEVPDRDRSVPATGRQRLAVRRVGDRVKVAGPGSVLLGDQPDLRPTAVGAPEVDPITSRRRDGPPTPRSGG